MKPLVLLATGLHADSLQIPLPEAAAKGGIRADATELYHLD